MGIKPPYIGLYGIGVWWVLRWGVWLRLGVIGWGWSRGMGWSLDVQGISNPDCNTLLRQNPARLNPWSLSTMTVPTPHPGLRGLSFATISYASLSVITRLTRWRRKQPVNHPKNFSTKTRIIGCIYSGKFGTEVTASVMGSCHHPNMVTPQRVMGEMTVSKS